MPRRAANTRAASDAAAERHHDDEKAVGDQFRESVRDRPGVKREPDRSRLIDETRTGESTGSRCATCRGPIYLRADGDGTCAGGHVTAGADNDAFRTECETGTVCPDCGNREYRTLSGIVCSGPTCEGRSDPSSILAEECTPESRPKWNDVRGPFGQNDEEAKKIAEDLASDVAKPTARLSPHFERIVERVLDVDFDEIYERIERELTLQKRASQAERALVADALDRAQDNARDAHRLYAAARVDLEAFDLDARAILADMRAQATAALEDEQTARKKNKEGAKRITEADVEDWCASHFHDEWRDMQIRRKKAEKAVEHFERLAELWKTRPKTLEALLASARV